MMRKVAYLFIGIASFNLFVSFLHEPLQAAQESITTQNSANNTDTSASQEANDSLWSVLAKSFSLQYSITPQVQAQIDWYREHPIQFYQLANQATPYLYYIYQKIQAYQIPAEIALLPLIESNYNPFVSSASGAGGLWQLMPNTAAELGIRQNWWYDGRRDIAASTKAALDYLDYLQTVFDGNWLLTFAAYNSGASAVQQAIGKNTRTGIPTGFWLLHLPQQTQNYVTKILALAAIIKEPDKYGIKLPVVKNEPYLEAVDVGSQIELAQVAKLAGMDLPTLYRLNPGYKHWATEPNSKHKLLLPIDVVDDFKIKLAQLPTEKRVKWDKYAVQPGDNLKQIASNFHIKPELVKEINNLRSDFVEVGKVLRLPLGSREPRYSPEIYYSKSVKLPSETSSREVNPIKLAASKLEQAQTQPQKPEPIKLALPPTPAAITSAENISPAIKATAFTVALAEKSTAKTPDSKPAPSSTVAKKMRVTSQPNPNKFVQVKTVLQKRAHKILHRVKAGETLFSIARNYKITRALLCQWNNLALDEELSVGDQLVIYQ
jgi:membrane-bound lytic murein transglycosylase D